MVEIRKNFFSPEWKKASNDCAKILQEAVSQLSSEAFDYKKKLIHGPHYQIQPPSITNIATLLLLLKIDENGIAYAPPTKTPVDPRSNDGNFENDFMNFCLTHDSKQQFVEPMTCTFYSVGQSATPTNNMLESIGLELFEEEDTDDNDEVVLEGSICQIDNYYGNYVSELDFKILGFLMNAKPYDINGKLVGLHDYQKILEVKFSANTFADDNLFVDLVMEYFDMDFWEFNGSAEFGLAYDIHRFRLFFSMICPVGLHPIDGRKRLFHAHKLFSGHNPQICTVPVKLKTADQKVTVPSNCNLMRNISINILLPNMSALPELSDVETSLVIDHQTFQNIEIHETNWKHWIQATLHKIIHAGDALPLETFIKLSPRARIKQQGAKVQTRDEFETIALKTQMIVGNCLLQYEPAKTMLTSAQAENPKNCFVPFEPNVFLENYIQNIDFCGYKIFHFQKVSTKFMLAQISLFDFTFISLTQKTYNAEDTKIQEYPFLRKTQSL